MLNKTIQKELDFAEFVAVHTDETLDVSCQTHMSIIFRDCVDDSAQERFIRFSDVTKNKTVQDLPTVILNALKDRNVGKKMICQTYDSASVVAGSSNY